MKRRIDDLPAEDASGPIRHRAAWNARPRQYDRFDAANIATRQFRFKFTFVRIHYCLTFLSIVSQICLRVEVDSDHCVRNFCLGERLNITG